MDINTSNPPVSISTDPPLYPAADFRLLRSEGIKWIQQLAGTSWTDHNTHDPGITILDLLCYAITDLSNRLDYDIKDLLATENGTAYQSLYSPAQVLTCNPVTLSDFRKVLLDMEGVTNAWIDKQIEPDIRLYYFPEENVFRLTNNENKGQLLHIKGIYNVLVDLKSGSAEAVKKGLQGYRNLCEDYNKVVAPAYQPVTVSGIVEVGQTANINQTAANMLARIARFIAPVPKFYTLAEMLAKGKAIDEIFEGPALAHGFIDDEELNTIHIKSELHTSDIIREIMDEPGVLRVSNIRVYDASLQTGDNYSATLPDQNWFMQLDKARFPALDVEITGGTNNVADTIRMLTFKKNGVPLTVNYDLVLSFFNTISAAQSKPALPLPLADLNLVTAQGDYYPLEEYYSIQNQFPQVYGIGQAGLPASASPLRKAQAKQLKAYLLFFDQILADYCSQAAHLKDLFSFGNTCYRTYFHQSIGQIVPGAGEIRYGSSTEAATYYEPHNKALQRYNQLLDHLIARFGESLSAYTLHQQSYEQKKQQPGDTSAVTKALEKLVNDKLRFLSQYPLLSNDRGKAFDYTRESWDTANVSGLQKRITAKLGIENDTAHSLTDGSEGFYLLEHILLRPLQEDNSAIAGNPITKLISNFEDAGQAAQDAYHTICVCAAHGLLNDEQIFITGSKLYDNGRYNIQWLSADRFKIAAPYKGGKENTAQWTRVSNFILFTNASDAIAQPDIYSLQLSCMFPAGAGRFADADFRTLVENTVREETPVHLTVYVRWLEPAQILQFENALRRFLNALQTPQPDGKLKWRASRNSLADMIPLGINTYPLADIPVLMPNGAAETIVQYNEPATVTLLYSQPDVVYTIWDQETGQPVNKQELDNKGNDGQIALKTISLTKDNYLFSIEALNPSTKMRVRLYQTIAVRIGINTGLMAIAKESEIAYGTNAIIIIKNAQSGTIYQVFGTNKKTSLSDTVESIDGGDLAISTKDPLQEDTGFTIKATNIHTHDSAFFDAPKKEDPPRTIKVYPNTALPAEEPAIADYNGSSAIKLSNTQESTAYYLSVNDIDDDDNTASKSGRKNQMIGKPVAGKKNPISLAADKLAEDLTVKIIAKKNDTGLEKPLLGTFTFKVRPDPGKILSIVKENTPGGDWITIKVNSTQPGIIYQLRKVIGDDTYENIGTPVFHHRNHGVGTARIETDFAIDYFTATDVFLPAGIVATTTVFNVLATKATTKLTAVVGNITVEVK